MSTPASRVPIYDTLNRIPGGLMIVPLILGSIVGTLAPAALDIGSFTTALFKEGAMAFMGLVIFATGMQITPRNAGPIVGTASVILLMKSVVPGVLIALLGLLTGMHGLFGISILAMLAAMDNSNGGIWLAFTGRYGDQRDRGAYIASAINDGPFFTLILIGASGLADIPLEVFLAAIVPLLLGILVGNLDPKWTEVLRPVPEMVIPFFSFGLGTGINLTDVLSGGISGLALGLVVAPVTGGLVYLGYRFLLKRGPRSGIGFAAGTTAGNSIATPAIAAAADPSLQSYVGVATTQVAACVLVSALMAPAIASWLLKRNGELRSPDGSIEPEISSDRMRSPVRPQTVMK
ncbi:2-keto-3-deoxygluconate permease [Salinicola rhizosphaerae]|uniref:2-keto-3-deoxygluconate permease n=1 Tax=Salinicola rhizosphaerae TaxID=1443141 RepID=A0ABQ3E6U0_9GAMM|nr:2-keto-3-deoxygluconate permease [Salinicola rhizosphaerae]GHB25120.1 2-keto-3-deoxygluconate permease [Salinicola rhizosphaerae]